VNERRAWIMVIGLAIGLAGYYLPWYSHPTAGFTMNAFDLAEWTSLHPAVRGESPAMLTSFLLRFPFLALLAGMLLVSNDLPDRRGRWMLRVGVLLIALRFLPPSDFLSSAHDDPNYRQMALFSAMLFLAAGGTPLLYRFRGVQTGAVIALLIGGVLAGWWGLTKAATLLDNFEIDIRVGPGLWVLTVISALMVLAELARMLPHLSRFAGAGQAS
jgi:hypothetical protein